MRSSYSRAKNLRLGAVVVMLAVALYTIWGTVAGGGSYGELTSMRESLETQTVHNQALRHEVEELRRDAYLLRHDPRMIERVARTELGLGRPNEVIYVFDRRGRTANEESK